MGKETSEVQDFSKMLFYPENYPEIKYKTITNSNVTIKIPIGTILCWDECIPCSPYYNQGLKTIGKGIETGFYIDQ